MGFNIATVTTAEAAAVIKGIYPFVKKPVFLWGTYGVGKSSIVESIRDSLSEDTGQKWGLKDVRASQFTAVDTRGIPIVKIDKNGHNRANFALPDWLPYVERDGEHGILFLDELLLGNASVQAAFYQLLNDGRLGDYILPENWFCVAASNRPEDGASALVGRKPDAALMTRFGTHLNIAASVPSWTEWAASHDIEPEVIAFIQFRGSPNGDQAGLLHEFPEGGVKKDQIAIATPRTWENVSGILKSKLPEVLESKTIQGAIGLAAASEFLAFLKILRKVPSFLEIFDNPDEVAIPPDLSLRYAVTAQLAAKVTLKDVANSVSWIKRIDDELVAVFFTLLTVRDDSFKSCPEYVQFKIENSKNVI